MKSCAVCIAKNEEGYLDEWLEWNFAVGFDKCVVYLNDWKYFGEHLLDPRVQWEVLDGEARQLDAYNGFLRTRSKDYDWAAFLDVDEFFYPNGNGKVNQILEEYDNCLAVAFNWKLFGGSNVQWDGKDRRLTTRFLRSQKGVNKHVKTFVNLSLCRKMGLLDEGYIWFNNPHCLYQACVQKFTISADRNYWVMGPFNGQLDDNPTGAGIPYIAHYFCKTRGEWEEKKVRGKADTPKASPYWARPDSDYDRHDYLDVENTDLLQIGQSILKKEAGFRTGTQNGLNTPSETDKTKRPEARAV